MSSRPTLRNAARDRSFDAAKQRSRETRREIVETAHRCFMRDTRTIDPGPLEPTRDFFTWFADAGSRRVVLLGCGSRLPSLLDWYRSLSSGVGMLHLGNQAHPTTPWRESVNREHDTPYVAVEAGYMPSADCPSDLLAVLERYQCCGKVCAGVRVAKIGGDWLDAEMVRRWETKFGMSPVDDQQFAATTVAGLCLYLAYGELATSPEHLRLANLYRGEYWPWYEEAATVGADADALPLWDRPPHAEWGPAAKRMQLHRSATALAYDCPHMVLAFRGEIPAVPGWPNARRLSARCQIELSAVPDSAWEEALEASSLDATHRPVSVASPQASDTLLTAAYRAAIPQARLWLRVPLVVLERTLTVFAGRGGAASEEPIAFDWKLESCGLPTGSASVTDQIGEEQITLKFRACKPPRRSDEITQSPQVQPILHPDCRAAAGFTSV
jgi:hypothetical protein